MPGPRPDYAPTALAAVRRGALEERCVDRAAGHVIDLVERTRPSRRSGASSSSATTAGDPAADESVYKRNARLAARAARESAVLLENSGILPLDPTKTVAVIGAFAREPRFQGAGSSKINPREARLRAGRVQASRHLGLVLPLDMMRILARRPTFKLSGRSKRRARMTSPWCSPACRIGSSPRIRPQAHGDAARPLQLDRARVS